MCGFGLLVGEGHGRGGESTLGYLGNSDLSVVLFQYIREFTVGPTHKEVTNVEYDGALHGWRSNEMTWVMRVLDFETSPFILRILE